MKYTTITAAALSAILLPFAAAAQEFQSVIATGYGTTEEKAKTAAWRAAVEQVVGSLVDAETVVENDELVRDTIRTFSPGRIENLATIGKPKKTDDGLWEVRVLAKVRKEGIREKLQAAGLVEADVSAEGEGAIAKIASTRKNLSDAAKVMKALFDTEKARACLTYGIVPDKDGRKLRVDGASGAVSVHIEGGIDKAAYKLWVDEIAEKIGAMASARHETVMPADSQKNWREEKRIDVVSDLVESDSKVADCQLQVLASLRSLKVVGFAFDQDKTAAFGASVPTAYRTRFRIALLDEAGDEIRIARWPEDAGDEDLDDWWRVFAWETGYDPLKIAVFPGWLGERSDEAQPEFKADVTFEGLTEADIKDVKKVAVAVEVKAAYRNN